MYKYFLFLLVVFCSFEALSFDDEINVVIFAPKTNVANNKNVFPSCNDAKMLRKVARRIKEYYEANPKKNILEFRKRALTLKNLKNFEEISVDNFDNKENYFVAKELVMSKINYHLKSEEMKLCRGNKFSKIYFLMYSEGLGVRVQILNFLPSKEDGNDFSIYIENEKA